MAEDDYLGSVRINARLAMCNYPRPCTWRGSCAQLGVEPTAVCVPPAKVVPRHRHVVWLFLSSYP